MRLSFTLFARSSTVQLRCCLWESRDESTHKKPHSHKRIHAHTHISLFNNSHFIYCTLFFEDCFFFSGACADQTYWPAGTLILVQFFVWGLSRCCFHFGRGQLPHFTSLHKWQRVCTFELWPKTTLCSDRTG